MVARRIGPDPAHGGLDVVHQRREGRLPTQAIVHGDHGIAPLQSFQHWQYLYVGLVAAHKGPAVDRHDDREGAALFLRKVDIQLLRRRQAGIGNVRIFVLDVIGIGSRRCFLECVVWDRGKPILILHDPTPQLIARWFSCSGLLLYLESV